jgi:2-octaprenyl-6-methoxyphenol hydroxylase
MAAVTKRDKRNAQVAVIGGGPAGLTAAIALGAAGIDTVLVAKRHSQEDHRTTALLLGSVTALDTLGVWKRCLDRAAPLRAMRIVDDTGRLLRAPEIKFEASEIGLDAFGYNLENRHLLAALDARTGELPAITRVEDEARSLDISEGGVTIALTGGGDISARLVIGADGRRSRCRIAAGIESDGQAYPQTALTFNLGHARPHQNISTEFHTRAGPFTLVPLPGQRSSLVYVTDPATARRLAEMDDDALAGELETRAHSILGKFTIEPGRGVFSLARQTARCFGARRVALVGEAAHVLPPIGAQGLNLGLRDVAMIAEIVVEARHHGTDIGNTAVLARYNDSRRPDVVSRMLAVDLLNRTLLSDFLPLQGARHLSFSLLDRIAPLRQAIMREGVAPAASQPRLMRGEAL